MSNVILIGMPGAGKSTIGVLLAKALGMGFVDTDLVIQEGQGALLGELLEKKGVGGFLEIEEGVLASLSVENCVVATGGSAVYSEKGMRALKEKGICVYLSLAEKELLKRIRNIKARGVVLPQGKSFGEVYKERLPLYEKYADATVVCDGKDIEEIVEEIAGLVMALGNSEK